METQQTGGELEQLATAKSTSWAPGFSRLRSSSCCRLPAPRESPLDGLTIRTLPVDRSVSPVLKGPGLGCRASVSKCSQNLAGPVWYPSEFVIFTLCGIQGGNIHPLRRRLGIGVFLPSYEQLGCIKSGRGLAADCIHG